MEAPKGALREKLLLARPSNPHGTREDGHSRDLWQLEYVNLKPTWLIHVNQCLPNRSCCGSQSTIITLSVNFPSILIPFSHFQKMRCGMRAKTRTNISTMCVGIEDTGMADPKVRTMKPACAPSAKV